MEYLPVLLELLVLMQQYLPFDGKVITNFPSKSTGDNPVIKYYHISRICFGNVIIGNKHISSDQEYKYSMSVQDTSAMYIASHKEPQTPIQSGIPKIKVGVSPKYTSKTI